MTDFPKLIKESSVAVNKLHPVIGHTSKSHLCRCFGGDVSWDETAAPGSTYKSSDECITHHIIDRPQLGNQLISRYRHYQEPAYFKVGIFQ